MSESTMHVDKALRLVQECDLRTLSRAREAAEVLAGEVKRLQCITNFLKTNIELAYAVMTHAEEQVRFHNGRVEVCSFGRWVEHTAATKEVKDSA